MWIGCTVFALVSVTRPSLAEPEMVNIGQAGDVALSAERLIGLRYERLEQELPEGGNEEAHWFAVGQGWTGGGVWSTPYDARRIGVDAFPLDSASIGFSTAFAYRSSNETEHWELVVEPRAGYLIMFDDLKGVWLRGGVYYHRSNVSDLTEKGWGLGGEVLGILRFTRRFALTIGLSFDQSVDVERDEYEREYQSLSLSLGLTGWLSSL